MLLINYGAWKLCSRQYDETHKLAGKFYLILFKDVGRTGQHIDYPIVYADKSVAYDNPHRIPQGLRRKVAAKAERGMLSLASDERMSIAAF